VLLPVQHRISTISYNYFRHHLILNSLRLAEGEGFEPPVPLRAQRFSRPPVSTTHTSLRVRAAWLSS
jgi:hypothetical protein